jgi:hypothetical protein
MSEAVMSWSCGVVRGAAGSSATTSLAGWQPDVLPGSRCQRPTDSIGIIGRIFFLALVVCRVVVAAPGATSTEADLLAVLRSESPEADKALSCKFLAVNGSAAAVGDLATLLANPRLASWARIALEVIPGDEASAALREAAARLNGRLLVGVINSLGVRGDSAAVPMLAGTLGDEDPEVAASRAEHGGLGTRQDRNGGGRRDPGAGHGTSRGLARAARLARRSRRALRGQPPGGR